MSTFLLVLAGSVEALHTEKGHLAEEKYQELGRKRAPNFTADRGLIYKVYVAYEVNAWYNVYSTNPGRVSFDLSISIPWTTAKIH